MFKKCVFLLMIALAIAPNRPLRAADAGEASPACRLTSVNGSETIDLADYQGRVLYLDFWASWCGPCAKSFPFMIEMQHEFGDKGLMLIGVNLDEEADDAKAFLARYPANFTVAADLNQACAQRFDIKGMPSSYLIGKDGVIRHVHVGFRPNEGKELRDMVVKLLNEKSPSAKN